MVIKSFKESHPLVLLLYFLSIIILTIIQSHYLVIIIGFIACALLFYLTDHSGFKKILKYLMLLILLITITNPLFVSEGFDILYQNNFFTITKQALIYGFVFSLMISSMLLIFNVARKYLTDSHIIYLFGAMMPTLGLVVSMSLNLISRLKLQYQKIKEANRLMPYKNKLAKQRDMIIILITYAFESSLEMINSMNGRGYGSHKRSSFHLYQFKKDDLLKILIILSLDLMVILGYFNYYQDFYYYPLVQVYHYQWLDLFFMICFAVLILLPVFFKGGKSYVSD